VLLPGGAARIETAQPLPFWLSVRDALAFGDCADADIAEIDLPAVGSMGVRASAEVGHALLKRGRGDSGNQLQIAAQGRLSPLNGLGEHRRSVRLHFRMSAGLSADRDRDSSSAATAALAAASNSTIGVFNSPYQPSSRQAWPLEPPALP
jgi:hypothetical protein